MNMLDFISGLEKLLPKWPDRTDYTVVQLADATATGVPQVVDYLSDILDKELEVHETVTRDEAAKALASMKDRMSGELAARQKRLDARRAKAIQAYDVAMEKVRVLQVTKNWRSSYKTLIYYVGCHEKDIPSDLLSELCGECLRLGFKSEANLQELSMWFSKGVAACLAPESVQGIEDALDFIDAWGGRLVEDDAVRGKRLLTNVIDTVRTEATAQNFETQFDAMVRNLELG